MVARFSFIAIHFRTTYKGNNFHNNTDESVNLESLNEVMKVRMRGKYSRSEGEI